MSFYFTELVFYLYWYRKSTVLNFEEVILQTSADCLIYVWWDRYTCIQNVIKVFDILKNSQIIFGKTGGDGCVGDGDGSNRSCGGNNNIRNSISMRKQ